MTRPSWLAFASAAAATVLFAAGPIASPAADITSAGELAIKTGFLVNFPKFVDWPSSAFGSPAEPFVVAVLGDDPLAGVIADAFKNRREGDRPVTVVRVSRIEEAMHSQMLYIGESEEKHLADDLKHLETQPSLTVGSFERFAERGGMIQLFTQDGRVRFALNSRTARRAGLKLSSRLLSLAGFVISD